MADGLMGNKTNRSLLVRLHGDAPKKSIQPAIVQVYFARISWQLFITGLILEVGPLWTWRLILVNKPMILREVDCPWYISTQFNLDWRHLDSFPHIKQLILPYEMGYWWPLPVIIRSWLWVYYPFFLFGVTAPVPREIHGLSVPSSFQPSSNHPWTSRLHTSSGRKCGHVGSLVDLVGDVLSPSPSLLGNRWWHFQITSISKPNSRKMTSIVIYIMRLFNQFPVFNTNKISQQLKQPNMHLDLHFHFLDYSLTGGIRTIENLSITTPGFKNAKLFYHKLAILFIKRSVYLPEGLTSTWIESLAGKRMPISLCSKRSRTR